MTCVSGTSVTSAFIDLATYDQLERNMYGGPDAFTFFVLETRKPTWFAKVPVQLTRSTGAAEFGKEFSVAVPRGGDYALNCWVRVVLPEVKLAAGNQLGENGTLRWCTNVMHNLFKEVTVTFNDLTAQRFDSFFLDFWSAFTTPGSKQRGYDNMVGSYNQLTQPAGVNGSLPSRALVLPLPFFFSRDTGVALPTAALPYNEIRLNFTLRDWQDLLVLQHKTTGEIKTVQAGDMQQAPMLRDVQIWMTQVVATNEERQLMGCSPRDMMVEQVQQAPRMAMPIAGEHAMHIDLRFSHAVKALFFGVKNVTHKGVQSNYTTASPVMMYEGMAANPEPTAAQDPVGEVTLTYENTVRLNAMGPEFFSLVEPWYYCPAIPLNTGYHVYTYCLCLSDVEPTGSTNYGRLNNVRLSVKPSPQALVTAAGGGGDNSGYKQPQKFELHVAAVNHNIIRIKSGSMGFPIL